MYMNLSEISFNNKSLVNFILVVFVVLGIFAFIKMSKLEDPEVPVRQAVIVTIFPGASSEKVEKEVTEPLERAIRSMGSVYELTSRSMASSSQITVSFDVTMPKDKVEQTWDILRKKVSDAKKSLPEGVMEPVVYDDFGDVFGMFYALQSDGFSYEEMYDYAKKIKQELVNVEGVRSVEIYGKRNAVINIEISQEKLAHLGINPLELVLTLNGQNETVYPGGFTSGTNRLSVVLTDDYKSIEDIRNLIIQGHENDQFKLGDIANVTRGYEEPYMMTMRHNKMPALGISVSMVKNENILKLGKSVTAKLEAIQKKLPVGLTIEKVFYQPEKVEKAIGSFIKNLIEAVLIVIVVLMFAMGYRSGIIIAVNLIFIILASIVVLYLLDGTLQRVSLGAFIVAMGMLVDNAIVVIDIILLDLQNGKSKREAFILSPKKVMMPLLGATVIAIIAFLPIFLSPDETGDYVRDLFVVLAVSLLISWVLAFVHIPLMGSQFLKLSVKQAQKKPFQGPLYNFFRKALDYSFQHRTATIGVMLGLLAVSVFGFRFVKQSFFPDLKYNQFYIEYSLPEGKNTKAVEDDIKKIEEWLMNDSSIMAVTSSMSSTPSRYCLVRSMAEPRMSYGELIVTFKGYELLKERLPIIQSYLTDNYPEAYVRIRRYNLIAFGTHLVEIMFKGSDASVLKDLAGKAEKVLVKNDKAILVQNDWFPKTQNIIVDYSQPLSRRAGLSRMDVSNSLLAATDGIPIGIYNENGENVPLILKTTDSKGKPIDNFADIPVWGLFPNIGSDQVKDIFQKALITNDIDLSSLMSSVPLSQTVRSIKTGWEEPLIRRFNGERAITVKCDVKQGYNAEELRKEIKSDIEAIKLPDGYTMIWRGEIYNQNKALQYILFYIPVAIIILIGILIAMFRDYKKPAIIILSIPFAIIGIVWGMVLTGKPLGFVAIVGAIGLMGMMVRNGVVLIEEIKHQTDAMEDHIQAIKQASISRLRPVILQSLACMLGLIPLISDDMFGGMAITIIGGLLIGTIITLIFIPILYTLFFNIKVNNVGGFSQSLDVEQ